VVDLKKTPGGHATKKSKARTPLGTLPLNSKPPVIGKPEDKSKILYPKKKAKLDPETGTFLRPRGRAPSGGFDWNETQGVWSVSTESK